MRAARQITFSPVDRVLFYLFLLLFTALPILSRVKAVNVVAPLITNFVALDTGLKGEFFTWYKFVLLQTIAVFVLLLFFYKLMGDRHVIVTQPIHWPLLVLVGAILCSVLFAPYVSVALFGFYDLHEGALTYLAYLILFFAASQLIYPRQRLWQLLIALSPAVLVNTVASLLTFYGVDLLQTPVIKLLLMPPSLASQVDAGSRFITTLGHPNYLSGFSAFSTVLYTAALFWVPELKRRWFAAFMAVCSFGMLLASLSVSGFLTLAAVLPVLLLLAWRTGSLRKGWPLFSLALAGWVLLFLVMNGHSDRVWEESFGLMINVQSKTLPVSTSTAGSTAPKANQSALPQLPPRGVAAGSGRLYIWQQTLELVKQQPLFGNGLDTLAYRFPQNDVGKQAGLGRYETFVSKPHNWYLSILYGAGLPALLSFLTLLLLLLHQIWHSLFKRSEAGINPFIPIFSLGGLAFLIQALVNDSFIGSTPIFWVLLGVTTSLLAQELSKGEQAAIFGRRPGKN